MINQAEMKAKLRKLSEADLALYLHDTVVFGRGAIREDRDGNVTYVPFLETIRILKETKRGDEKENNQA